MRAVARPSRRASAERAHPVTTAATARRAVASARCASEARLCRRACHSPRLMRRRRWRGYDSQHRSRGSDTPDHDDYPSATPDDCTSRTDANPSADGHANPSADSDAEPRHRDLQRRDAAREPLRRWKRASARHGALQRWPMELFAESIGYLLFGTRRRRLLGVSGTTLLIPSTQQIRSKHPVPHAVRRTT